MLNIPTTVSIIITMLNNINKILKITTWADIFLNIIMLTCTRKKNKQNHNKNQTEENIPNHMKVLQTLQNKPKKTNNNKIIIIRKKKKIVKMIKNKIKI